MGGMSHELIKKGMFVLEVDSSYDEERVDCPFDFEITLGNGWSKVEGGYTSVGIDKINLKELKGLHQRLGEIIDAYQSQPTSQQQPIDEVELCERIASCLGIEKNGND